MLYEGYLDRIFSKPYQGKMLYSFKIRDNDTYFRLGEKQLKCKEGSKIKFEANEKNGVNPDDVVVEAVTSQTEQAPRATTNKESYWDAKEARDIETGKIIQYQAARNSAISVADLILKNDGLALPSDTPKKYQVIMDLVNSLTVRFFDEAQERKPQETAGGAKRGRKSKASEAEDDGVDLG